MLVIHLIQPLETHVVGFGPSRLACVPPMISRQTRPLVVHDYWDKLILMLILSKIFQTPVYRNLAISVKNTDFFWFFSLIFFCTWTKLIKLASKFWCIMTTLFTISMPIPFSKSWIRPGWIWSYDKDALSVGSPKWEHVAKHNGLTSSNVMQVTNCVMHL